MNSHELRILKQIEAGLSHDDAAFADRISSGPQLSGWFKVGLGIASVAGIALTMMFPMHLYYGVAGYLVLVAVGTSLLRHRPMKPADESPLQCFHRLTAGLFVNTSSATESSLDWDC